MIKKLFSSSNAKINLFLHIVGKRVDGYHLLESLFLPVKIADDIHISESDEVECISDIPDNLILKVALKLKAAYCIKQGAKIELVKRIPIAAGLGGGSSNAAAALRLLCNLWNIDMSLQEMVDLTAPLGADIPFFFANQPAFVSGIGENIQPVILKKKYHYLLLNCGQVVSTPAVFQIGFQEFTKSIADNNPEDYIIIGHNDLEANAIAICPAIQETLAFLKARVGCYVARVSGSGATCFGLFETAHDAKKAYDSAPKNWFAFIG